MFLIDTILVDESLAKVQFCCDLNKCKGACCTLPGGDGAPLLNEEVELVERSVEAASLYLSQRSKDEIAKRGSVSGSYGDYSTTCIDNRDCVFVFYDDGIAKCAIEKAHFDGLLEFRKPISCHLFPIRVGNFGGDYISYQPFSACSPAVDKGKKENIYAVEMLREPLTRLYGSIWYDALCDHIATVNPEFTGGKE